MTGLADISCTAEELAAVAGISARHVRRLALPKAGRNRYLLADTLPPLIEALTGGGEGETLTAERTRLVKAQADRAELELAKARGEVALIAEFEAVQTKVMAAIRVRMLNVPRRAVTQIVGDTDESRITAVLASEIKLALTTVMDDEAFADPLEDDDANGE